MIPQLVIREEQKQWFSKSDPMNEFEIRFSLNNMNGVTKPIFDRILSTLVHDNSFTYHEKDYTYVNYEYDNRNPELRSRFGNTNYRMLQAGPGMSSSENGLYSKTQVSKRDLSFLAFKIRLSEAKETFENRVM